MKLQLCLKNGPIFEYYLPPKILAMLDSSIIRQKGKSQNGFMKTKHAKFYNKHFLPPDTHTCVYESGGRKCLFFGKCGVLCSLKTPVLRFALLVTHGLWKKNLWFGRWEAFACSSSFGDSVTEIDIGWNFCFGFK